MTTALAIWIAAGFGIGLVYFAVLRRSIEAFAADGRRLMPAMLALARIAAIVTFLGLAARAGALPLLLALLGFLMARMLALRAARRTA
jgi:hypothetical protein